MGVLPCPRLAGVGSRMTRRTANLLGVQPIEGDPLEITARHSAGRSLELVLHLPDGSATPMASVSAALCHELAKRFTATP